MTRTADGTLQVQLLNPEGEPGEEVYPVCRVVQLYQHGLMTQVDVDHMALRRASSQWPRIRSTTGTPSATSRRMARGGA